MFLVCTLPTDAAGLLGTGFLERTGANVNFECGKMALAAIDKATRAYEVVFAKSAALTVFTEGEARRSPQPTRREELHTEGLPSDDPRSDMTASESESWLVRVTENITAMPAHCDRKIRNRKRAKTPLNHMCRTGTYSHTRNPARPSSFTSRTDSAGDDTSDVTATRNEMAARENSVHVMITIFSEESLTVPKSTVIGVAEQVSEAWVNHVNTGELSKSSVTIKHKEEMKNAALYQRLL